MAAMTQQELVAWRREGEKLEARREQADIEDAPLLAEINKKTTAYYLQQFADEANHIVGVLPGWRRWLAKLALWGFNHNPWAV